MAGAELSARVPNDLAELSLGLERIEPELPIRRFPAPRPPLPVLGSRVRRVRDHHHDVVADATHLPIALHDAERPRRLRQVDAGHVAQVAQLPGLEKNVVLRGAARPLDAEEKLRRERAADPHPQPAHALQLEVEGGQIRSQLREPATPLFDALVLCGVDGLHQGLRPSQELGLSRLLRREPFSQARHIRRSRGLVVGAPRSGAIALKKLIEKGLPLGCPPAGPACQINGAQEPNDVEGRRAVDRVVEIVEAVIGPGEGVLAHVWVAVEADLRHLCELGREHDAHGPGPVAIDEAKVDVGVGLEVHQEPLCLESQLVLLDEQPRRPGRKARSRLLRRRWGASEDMRQQAEGGESSRESHRGR